VADVSPKLALLVCSIGLLLLAVIGLVALIGAYWPFQPAVEVIAPFLVISILTSVGLSLALVAFLLPGREPRGPERSEAASAIDSLLSETRRRP